MTAQFRAFNERRQCKVSLRAGAIATAEPFLDNFLSYTCPSTVATRSAMISVVMGHLKPSGTGTERRAMPTSRQVGGVFIVPICSKCGRPRGVS